jgi:outer membrane biosynthesis protein TonB
VREKNLYLEHYRGESFKAAKKVSPKFKHFVIGSSRVADLRLLGNEVGGVQAVLEYRSPNWFLVGCGDGNDIFMNENPVDHLKIEGGEAVRIGEHYLKFYLTDPQRPLYSVEEDHSGKDLNCHQVLVVCQGDIYDAQFLGRDEAYQFAFDGEELELEAPKSKEWEIRQYGKFIVKQRLTHKPKDEDRQRPSLKLVHSQDMKTAGVSLFAFFMVFLSVAMFKPSDPTPHKNKFVRMIYDAKIMEQLKEEAEQASQQRFVASEQKQKNVEKTPEKEYVAKVVKNIRAKGLSNLIGRIAKRASKNAINIKALQSMNPNEAKLKHSSVTSAELLGDKLKVSDKKYKVRKLAAVNKLSGEAKSKGGKLSKGNVAQGKVGILEEEILLDGGLDREVIAAYIRSKLGQIRYCYERQLASNSDLHGKVMVKFTIGSTGKVVAKRVASTTMKNAIVEGCILRRIATWKFPTPKGGTEVDVSYPFLFKSVN